MPICCDNQNAIALADNPKFHPWTKHTSVKFQHIREVVKSNDVHIPKVKTQDNGA